MTRNLNNLFVSAVAACLSATILSASLPASAATGPVQTGVKLATRVSPTGYYAAPYRGSNGHIDAVKTLTNVKKKGANTYQFLLANRFGQHSVVDLADMPHFLTVARTLRIKVWIILVPPTEAVYKFTGNCSANQYPPYNGNYINGWAAALGRLAKTHSALVGWGIDDFGYNTTAKPNPRCQTFTPTVIAAMRVKMNTTAKRSLNFAPTLYFPDLTVAKIPSKIKLTDVTYPFVEVGREGTLLKARIAAIRKLYPKLRIHLMIYAEGTRFYGKPTAATVDAGVKVGKALPGVVSVIIYNQQLS